MPIFSAFDWQHVSCALLVALACCLSGCSGDPQATLAEQPATNKTEAKTEAPAAQPPPAKHTNRLAKETSPYLLMHAHNPVDWYPWGEEAFDKAKREGKVVFLSVGYSSCHWCHVMERESFMDEEIAAYMNEHFVCIKVDREERPDVDSIYMTALQIYNQMTGSGRGGGWPMSVFLTPEAKPFFGGSYFPARDGQRGAAMGFFTLLKRIEQAWTTQRENIEGDADQITKLVQSELDGRLPSALRGLDSTLLDEASVSLQSTYDEEYGGFGYAPANPRMPKFPEPSNLVFLNYRLQQSGLSDEKKDAAKQMLLGTLDHMAMGGVRDHVGGGFHRYSVDRFWRIPHFEKMLYDNGQLASVYSDAYAITGRAGLKRIVDEMLAFVLRELTDPGGAFYAALDAESEDEEGKFYRWDKQEVLALLEPDEFALAAEIYGLDEPPNFEDHYYVLQLSAPLAETAKAKGLGEDELDQQLASIRAKLLASRNKRPRPFTDTKILTSWNGLMIRGFADAGRNFEDQAYLDAAAKAADFVLAKLRTKDGRLLRTYSKGQAKLNAYLNDYAFLVDGLIALHRATGDEQWLQTADELTEKQLELFWDQAHGGFYFTSGDHESLLARGRDPVDGAEPSGNSVAAENLVYLGEHLHRQEYLDKAKATIQYASGLLQRAPAAAPRTVIAFAEWMRVTAAE